MLMVSTIFLALVVAAIFAVGFWNGHRVARVLFAETAGCSPQERALVAGVMRNRIGHQAFDRLPNLEAVVRQPDAFSCVDDPDNTNWRKSRHPNQMTPVERAVWDECLVLARGAGLAVHGPSGRPLVYYHDRSITKPRSWDNDRWRAIREQATAHFVFYSIVPVRP